MNNFGAYMQVYKNPYATFKCLESFRTFYPYNTIILVSDNGFDYTNMAYHFNCIYIHSNDNLWYWYIHEKTTNYQQLQWIHLLLHRLTNCFSLIKEDYIIWLEDDVSINNLIYDDLLYDINGFNPNAFSKHTIIKLNQIYHYLNINTQYTWSGHGGSIFNKNNMIKYMQNFNIINDIGINWYNYVINSHIACDMLLSLITHLNNGTVGPLNNHLDCNYLNTNIDIQHQYKVFYNIEMPEHLKYLYSEKSS